MADTEVLDREYDPSAEPESSQAWLNLIEDAEKKFKTYQEKCDRIDELYADLVRLSDMQRDPEFKMFWANVQVLLPSVYSRPPVPVVVPEFKDRNPVKRQASELLERCLIKTFDLYYIDTTMRCVRDDMLLNGRGVAWIRYESKAESDGAYEKACIEYLDRKDFVHDPARNWYEVGWVARRAWMTRKEMKARFNGDAYLNASFSVQKQQQPDGSTDPREKAGVWEIWHKGEDKVVWVTEGVEELLDSGKPHLKLEGFFPCPRPAYTTLQRRSLIPIPDMLYYKDQLDEINKLTRRIHALSEAVQVKGFYPGGGEIGDAVEAALNINDDRKIMIPVSNMAAFGNGGDSIIWLPIDVIATTIAGLIEMRRQVIDDVYQITGLSDIMRGATDPGETLGAQELKSQYGSIRIRERQYELVRVARDITRITGEIMAENFSKTTLLALSQMEMPTRAEIAQQVQAIETQAKQLQQQTQQIQQVAQSPEGQQKAQQNPEQAQQQLQQMQQQAQQALQQAAQQMAELETLPTIEDVMELFRDQRVRPFALDIETDSTIQPDENAEKEQRAEFLTAMATVMQQLAPLVQAAPGASGFAGELLKFALAPFRVGRELESSVDEFVEQMQQQQGQQQESPEAIAAKAEAEARQQELQMKQAEMKAKFEIEQQKSHADAQAKQLDAALKQQEAESNRIAEAEKHGQEMQKGQLELQKIGLEIERLQVQAEAQRQQAQIQAATAAQDATIKSQQAEQSSELAERADERQASSAEQSADIAERQAQVKERSIGNSGSSSR